MACTTTSQSHIKLYMIIILGAKKEIMIQKVKKTKFITKTTEAEDRKNTPVYSGVLKYFPDAIKEVSRVSLAGNLQHNKGQPLHWDRSKSTDEADALLRHLIDAGKLDTDGIRHTSKVAWRALALLQKEIENDRK